MPANTTNHGRLMRIAIVGGGISGLATAWYLQAAVMQHQIAAEIDVYEQTNRLGGKITTTTVDHEAAQFVIEAGPDSMLRSKPWAFQLAQELGIAAQHIGTNMQQRTLYVWKHNRLHRVPTGFQLIVPTQFMPVLTSPLFGWGGKLRLLCERFIPRRRATNDESLYDFLTRRYGAEIRDTLGIPLMAGIYNADAKQQSMQATFPQYVHSERQHGSIAAGIKPPTTPATPPTSLFFTFPQGTQYLVDTLVAQLYHVTIHTNHPIQQITRNEGHYQIHGKHHAPIDADIVVLSTPAHHTAKLISTMAPALATQLQSQLYVSTGTISLAYRRDALPTPLDGYGVLYADGKKRYFNAITISSQKFTQRAPSSHILIRMFFGGQSNQELLAMDDHQISAFASAELQKVLNITTPPEFTRIFRWPFGTPQYTLDHHQWLAQCVAQTPSQLFLTGSSYGGIGIPDCIHHAQNTAQQIIHSYVKG